MKLPQVSLRDLFWLVLVAACVCAWWVDRSRIADRERAADERERAARDLEAEWHAEAKVLQQLLSSVQQMKERLPTIPSAKTDPVPVESTP